MKDQGFLNSENIFVINSLSQLWRIFPESRPTLILGYLDDIILVPLGIVLVIKLTPSNVIEASRSKAAKVAIKPISHVAAAVVIGTWLLCATAFGYWVWEYSR